MAREGATSGRSGSGSSMIKNVWGKASKPAVNALQGFAGGAVGNAMSALSSASLPQPQSNITSYAPTYQQASYALPAQNIAAAPAAPARPTYSMSDSNERIAQVDGTFLDQESAYNTSLEKFVADIARRKKSLQADTKTSKEGIERNRTLGMTGIGEDFAARGLGHSGLFVDASEKGQQAYDRQRDSVIKAETDGINELNFSESKERSDTANRIQAAKRDALYRLQLNNNLVTGL